MYKIEHTKYFLIFLATLVFTTTPAAILIENFNPRVLFYGVFLAILGMSSLFALALCICQRTNKVYSALYFILSKPVFLILLIMAYRQYSGDFRLSLSFPFISFLLFPLVFLFFRPKASLGGY